MCMRIGMQNRESTMGYSRWKVESRHGKFEESGLNNWSTSKFHHGGRNQMSGRVSVPCWHATAVANAQWKPLIIGEGKARYQGHEIGGKSDWLESHCWSRNTPGNALIKSSGSRHIIPSCVIRLGRRTLDEVSIQSYSVSQYCFNIVYDFKMIYPFKRTPFFWHFHINKHN